MERVAVRSSNLRSVGFDDGQGELEVEFHGGRIYRYYGVPGSIYLGLIQATSLGNFFATNIKNRYRSRRIC